MKDSGSVKCLIEGQPHVRVPNQPVTADSIEVEIVHIGSERRDRGGPDVVPVCELAIFGASATRARRRAA
jgi:hypothetical protein